MSRPVWKGIIWEIQGSNYAHLPLTKSPLPNRFRLKRKTKRNATFYRVKPVDGMSDRWRGCVLFELGSEQLTGARVPVLGENPTAEELDIAGQAAREEFQGGQYKFARLVG